MRRWSIVSVVELREVSTNSAWEVDFDDFLAACHRQRDREFHESTDCDGNPGVLNLGEPCDFDRDRISARGQQPSIISTLSVARRGSLQSLGGILHGDGRIGDNVSLGSFTVTCRSPVATPPCASDREQQDKPRHKHSYRANIRFSLGLAKASRRRELLHGRLPMFSRKGLERLAPLVFITERYAKTSKE